MTTLVARKPELSPHPWRESVKIAEVMRVPHDLSEAGAIAGHKTALSIIYQAILSSGLKWKHPTYAQALALEFRLAAGALRRAREKPDAWQGWGLGKPPSYSYAAERVYLLAARQLRVGRLAIIRPQGSE